MGFKGFASSHHLLANSIRIVTYHRSYEVLHVLLKTFLLPFRLVGKLYSQFPVFPESFKTDYRVDRAAYFRHISAEIDEFGSPVTSLNKCNNMIVLDFVHFVTACRELSFLAVNDLLESVSLSVKNDDGSQRLVSVVLASHDDDL